jgi:hypothetical protein
MMGHDRLANHYKTNFGMIQHHKWSLEALEAMMPWERYIYVDLLQDYLREEEKKRIDRENDLKAKIQSANRKRM